MTKDGYIEVWKHKSEFVRVVLRGKRLFLEVGSSWQLIFMRVDISEFWSELADFIRSREQSQPEVDKLSK